MHIMKEKDYLSFLIYNLLQILFRHIFKFLIVFWIQFFLILINSSFIFIAGKTQLTYNKSILQKNAICSI